ncbi:hypothetical protein [Burkholderia vietnamiensis]|uniref:hypothetical protein n=1 Tax=Burkholderia vietnamiensis TaxID=60552 RepID=UPI00158AD995|nr:hypothetical protein [Burkholderia vietnamiensis]
MSLNVPLRKNSLQIVIVFSAARDMSEVVAAAVSPKAATDLEKLKKADGSRRRTSACQGGMVPGNPHRSRSPDHAVMGKP